MKLISPLLAAAIILVAGCSKSPANQAQTPAVPGVSVTIDRVIATEVAGTIEIPGTVRPVQRATVAARMTGTVVELPLILGQRVDAGALLVKLSADEIDARLAQARAQLNAATRDLERERILFEKGVSPPEAVRSLEDRHAGAAAMVREAETMLGYTELRAPFAAVVTRKQVEIGDLAVPGQPLLGLDGIEEFHIEAAVPDSLIGTLELGAAIPVAFPTSGQRLDTRVVEISSAADSSARAVTVKLALPRPSEARSGQFARVLLPGPSVRALLVPASAVSRVGQMERVFVVGADRRAGLRLVKTGATHGERIEILSGLDAGETIIVAPPAGLREGQSLEVRS